MNHEFWKTSGLHLVTRDERGWLVPTPDLLRAYLLRPELHPVEESCAAEQALHAELMDDPLRPVTGAETARFADRDAAENYAVFLRLRDLLASSGTIEAAYLALARGSGPALPALFMDQLAHLVVHGLLASCDDPMRLRAAELFFREQNVALESGRVMLADEEVVAMHAEKERGPGITQLLAEAGIKRKSVELDVLDEANASLYWSRSDRFDMVVDFRVGKPVVDAFARVVEAWIAHFHGVIVRVEPRERIDSSDWRWHIGLDRQASGMLDALYAGRELGIEEAALFIGLFRMTFADPRHVIERVRGSPVFLGLAMTPQKRVRMKPQNLLANLPLAKVS